MKKGASAAKVADWVFGQLQNSPLASLNKLGVAPGGGTDDILKLLKAVLGLPLQLVSTYKGTAPVRLAFNGEEVLGAWTSIEFFKVTWRNEMDKGELVIVIQATLRAHPEIPNVPWAYELARTDDIKK